MELSSSGGRSLIDIIGRCLRVVLVNQVNGRKEAESQLDVEERVALLHFTSSNKTRPSYSRQAHKTTHQLVMDATQLRSLISLI